MWKKILVAIDGSAPSLHALEVAAGMAVQNNAELTVLSVVPPIPSMGLEGEMPQLTGYTDTIEESIKKKSSSTPLSIVASCRFQAPCAFGLKARSKRAISMLESDASSSTAAP